MLPVAFPAPARAAGTSASQAGFARHGARDARAEPSPPPWRPSAPALREGDRSGALALAAALWALTSEAGRRRPRGPAARGAGRRGRAEAEAAGTFVPLGISSPADVVRERLRTAAVAAELLRGVGGRGALGPACAKALAACAAFAEQRLPAALRGRARVLEALGRLAAALAAAGGGTSREAFLALEAPLLELHASEGQAVRKAFHARLAAAAELLLRPRAPPEARPLGAALASLAAAVRGPSAGGAKWKAPEVLQLRGESRMELAPGLREAVLQRDGFACWYCGRAGSETVDHWLPLCRGGTNDEVNLVCACARCNELKGNRMPDEFRPEEVAEEDRVAAE